MYVTMSTTTAALLLLQTTTWQQTHMGGRGAYSQVCVVRATAPAIVDDTGEVDSCMGHGMMMMMMRCRARWWWWNHPDCYSHPGPSPAARYLCCCCCTVGYGSWTHKEDSTCPDGYSLPAC